LQLADMSTVKSVDFRIETSAKRKRHAIEDPAQ